MPGALLRPVFTLLNLFENGSARRLSKRLIASYVVDWIFILITVALGRIFKVIEPNRNPFSLRDPSISYPHVKGTVSTTVLIIISLLVPAVAIAVLSLIVIPGRSGSKHAVSKSSLWQRKLWEWNAGWMGLGVAYAATYATTEGLKLMYGKPRPDLLSRCDPDLSDIQKHMVGGLKGDEFGTAFVTWSICRNRAEMLAREGFVSFPSGHSSMSFAGLLYLSLWICAKLSISFPHLPPRPFTGNSQQTAFSPPSEQPETNDRYVTKRDSSVQLRDQAAAPPVYLVFIAILPVVAATYIASSRWVDNRHFGFDILFGSLLGSLFAWVGFRMYNLPLKSGAGWAWGPRSPSNAFFAGVGYASYTDQGSSNDSCVLPQTEDPGIRERGNGWSNPPVRPASVNSGHLSRAGTEQQQKPSGLKIEN